METFVARQPVFTLQKKIFGYEMLFRNGIENTFSYVDGNQATSAVLSNTFFSMGLEDILGGKPGLVNFTRNLILQGIPKLFSTDQIIIEVLENIEPEKEILDALISFRKSGFQIALDDFVYHKRFKPMMEICKIIKFDFIATPPETLGPVIKQIQQQYPVITLLAEKVETYQAFETAKQMGFELFQGFFFSRPQMLQSRDISTGHMTKLKLISEVTRAQLDVEKIETYIKEDASVSFKLLKFINSAYFRRATPINTVKDAILFLGTDELRKFINIVLLSELGARKPGELIRTSLIRAKMCEKCGSVFRTDFNPDELFTLGLFSLMDAVLDRSMADILVHIDFSEKIKDALLGHNKKFNQFLKIIITLERGEWNHKIFKFLTGTKAEEKLPGFYLDAVKMAASLGSA